MKTRLNIQSESIASGRVGDKLISRLSENVRIDDKVYNVQKLKILTGSYFYVKDGERLKIKLASKIVNARSDEKFKIYDYDGEVHKPSEIEVSGTDFSFLFVYFCDALISLLREILFCSVRIYFEFYTSIRKAI